MKETCGETITFPLSVGSELYFKDFFDEIKRGKITKTMHYIDGSLNFKIEFDTDKFYIENFDKINIKYFPTKAELENYEEKHKTLRQKKRKENK